MAALLVKKRPGKSSQVDMPAAQPRSPKLVGFEPTRCFGVAGFGADGKYACPRRGVDSSSGAAFLQSESGREPHEQSISATKPSTSKIKWKAAGHKLGVTDACHTSIVDAALRRSCAG